MVPGVLRFPTLKAAVGRWLCSMLRLVPSLPPRKLDSGSVPGLSHHAFRQHPFSTDRSWHGDTLAQSGWQSAAILKQLKGAGELGLIQPPQEGSRWIENRHRDGEGIRPSKAVYDIHIGSLLGGELWLKGRRWENVKTQQTLRLWAQFTSTSREVS